MHYIFDFSSLVCYSIWQYNISFYSLNTLETKNLLLFILEQQYAEAAVLYESGNFHEKAAALYIRLKNWTKVGQLLVNINSPKMHLQVSYNLMN